MGTGTLFLVVGPSASGKDSILQGVRERLEREGYGNLFVVARRVITRPSVTGIEGHIEVSRDDFKKQEFFLQWEAHGFQYGIPSGVREELHQGKNVIVSISRSVLDEGRKQYSNCATIYIDADERSRLDRLHARGREGVDEINGRIVRERTLAPEYRNAGIDGLYIKNDSDEDLARAIDAMVEFVVNNVRV